MKIILCFSVVLCLSTQTFQAHPPTHPPYKPFPYSCPPNEKFVQCLEPEPTCSIPNPGLQIVTAICKPGCTCNSNSLRLRTRCVLPHMCPVPKKCGNGEEFKHCIHPCPRTCENCRKYALCPAIECIKHDACDCKSGFFRSERTGKCIPDFYCTKCN